jgi:SAM-dependent methyltransferase
LLRPSLTHVSRQARELIPRLLAELPADARVLNVGSGGTSYGERVTNLDIAPGPNVDVVAPAEALPFEAGSFDAVVMMAVLEHVADSNLALQEIRRVLCPAGEVVVAIPFIQGWHPAPLDRRRYTREGLAAELDQHGFNVIDSGISTGPASGMAWVTAEFLALLLSGRSRRAHRYARVVTSWLAWPLKWLDVWLAGHQAAEVIASGVWVRARRI